jgi:predicted RNase H-like HicB family nuclease
MNVRASSVSAERQAFPEQEFLAWLDEETTTALISESHGQFYAYCVEFGISGSGPTKEEALQDAVSLLMRYLLVSFSEDRPYRDTKKPPPARIRLQSWYLFARRKTLRKIKPLSRLGWLTSVPTTNHDSHRLAL